MALHYELLKWTWLPLAPAAQARLAQILAEWKGTPYCPNARIKGRQGGVDCVRFVCSVLDEFLQREAEPIYTLPPDAAMHTRAGALEVMRRIVRRYEPVTAVEDGTIKPGDVVVVGHPEGGPGHAMIAGTVPNTLWQASTTCVHFTGLGLVAEQQKVFRVYRIDEISKWSSN